jgi:hypothetical protein
MKTTREFSSAIFILLLLSGVAVAQEKSLLALPKAEKFISTEAGFSISLPREPNKTNNDGTTTGYVWNFKEGDIVIEYGEYLPATEPSNSKTHQAFLDGYKGGFMKQQHVRFVSEAPYSVGPYRGMSYTIEIPTRKLRIRDSMLTYGKKYFSIAGAANVDVPGSEALILKALNTLGFVVTPGKLKARP